MSLWHKKGWYDKSEKIQYGSDVYHCYYTSFKISLLSSDCHESKVSLHVWHHAVKNTRCLKSINVKQIKLEALHYKGSWAPFYLISTDSSIIYSPKIYNRKVQSNIDEPYENYITCTCFRNDKGWIASGNEGSVFCLYMLTTIISTWIIKDMLCLKEDESCSKTQSPLLQRVLKNF